MHLAIEESNDTYYSDLSAKLAKHNSNPKIYWSFLKRFFNNKKIPCIPSLFYENKLATNFRKIAGIFNSFLAKQCSLINSDSSLPAKIIKNKDNSLYSVKFSTEIFYDEISIRMLKICGSSICRPLQIIYKSGLDRGKFPQEWKKANVVPVHKKNDKQLVKNYRPCNLYVVKFLNVFHAILCLIF